MHILITGMHRSGTSLTAKIVHELGGYLGDPEELLPPSHDNLDGFCERFDVMQINDELLDSVGANWHSPPKDGLNFWQKGFSSDRLKIVERARQVIRKLEPHALWAIKDPRFCLTLGLWGRLLPNAKYVVCLRNPYEVAQSLNKRQGFDEDYSLMLWLHYYRLFIQATRCDQRLVIYYQHLFDKSDRELHRMTHWLKLSPDEKALQSALRCVKVELRNHWLKGDELPKSAEPQIRDLYYRLLAETGDRSY
jgi:hypothetical protein